MKKILIITGIIVALLVATLAVIPLFFKSTLLEKTKTAINKNVNADVEFANLKLSLLRSFPKLTLELTDVLVTGKGEFQPDTLFSVPSLRAKTGLGQLLNTDNMGIEEIILVRPRLKLVVGTTGNVNWDLALEKETEPDAVDSSADSGLELALDKIDISDALFVYDDREMDMLLRFEDINIGISGNMYGTEAQLLAEGISERFSLDYKEVTYISDMAVETRTLLGVDYDKMDIVIKENELLLNRLPMEVTGVIQMPADSMFFDLQVKTKDSGFDNFLALVPPDYEAYMQDIQTRGTASLSGTVKGFYIDEEYPAFDLSLDVEDGNVHYADLPEEIKNISADVSIVKPQGVLDLTEVNIKKAHAEVKNSPVDLTLTLKNLISDPFFDGAFTGKVNFNELKDALPMDSVDITGFIDANISVNGNYSAVENEQYNNIKSDGTVLLSNFVYESPEYTQPIIIPDGELNFSPEAVTLNRFNVKVGQSDFNLQGNVTSYLPYILNDGTLAGNLSLNAPLVNLNELLRLQVVQEPSSEESQAASQGGETAEQETLVFDVPKNIDITFRSDIQQVIFNRLPITDVNGLISARDGKVVLEGLNMHALGGELNLTGSYENTVENQPLFDFGFDIVKVDVPLAYQTLTGIQKMIPIAGQSQGKFSSSLKVNGKLTPQFGLIASEVDGSGQISTQNLQIINSPMFNQLKGLLKAGMLNNVRVGDFSAQVEIIDGAIFLKPFTTKVAGQEATISGNLNTQNLMDMQLDFNIERDAFGTDIQNILNALPGEERIKFIPASVLVKGPVGKPDVKIDLKEARKKITEEVKRSTKEDMQKSIEKFGEGLKKLF